MAKSSEHHLKLNYPDVALETEPLLDESLSTAVSAPQRVISDLSEVPVENVEIQAASRLVSHLDPGSPSASRFRFLRMYLREFRHQRNLRSLVVTSALPQDGKSTVALNLATALTEKGKRSVLLLEADFYQSTVLQRLGLRYRWLVHPGLAECLERDIDPMSAIRRIEPLQWYLLPAGAPHSQPSELLQSDALGALLERVSAYFDWIVIDAPPVIPVIDGVSLSRRADASLLVVRADQTPRDVVEQALSLLGPQHTLGIILNGAKELNRLYSEYSDYYSK